MNEILAGNLLGAGNVVAVPLWAFVVLLVLAVLLVVLVIARRL